MRNDREEAIIRMEITPYDQGGSISLLALPSEQESGGDLELDDRISIIYSQFHKKLTFK